MERHDTAADVKSAKEERAPKADVGSHGPSRGAPAISREQLVLNLQRRVGNRAVAALVGIDGTRGRRPESRTVGPAVEVQRDLVSDSQQLLDYSLTDWAVTDADATQALAKLGQIPDATLRASLMRLGVHLLDRLFENLPDSAKTGTAYARVVTVAALLGAARIPDAWAGIATAPAPNQRSILFNMITVDDLGALVTDATVENFTGPINGFLRTLPEGEGLDATGRVRVRKIFDTTRDAQVLTLMWCLTKRFGVGFGRANAPSAGNVAAGWEATGLRRIYPVLEGLPSAHVASNAMLTFISRYRNAASTAADGTVTPENDPILANGYYRASATEIALAYDPATITSDNSSQTDAGDPLADVNRFDSTVRHEVGHAVDAQLGWSAGAEPKKRARGAWTVYATDHDRCAKAMINASDGAISRMISADKRRDIRSAMVDAMANRNPAGVDAAVRAFPWWSKLSVARRTALLNDKAIVALKQQFVESGPWWRDGGGIQIGKYVFHESYKSTTWVRYEHAARGWKASDYQFRAPGEWFAEAYAAYYEPDPRGLGAKLADADQNTKAYFDRVVNPMAPSR